MVSMKLQTNLRLPQDLRKVAERYAKTHHYKNLQELAKEAIREKVMKRGYDESFTQKEIELIDKLVELSILRGKIKGEKELWKALK